MTGSTALRSSSASTTCERPAVPSGLVIAGARGVCSVLDLPFHSKRHHRLQIELRANRRPPTFQQQQAPRHGRVSPLRAAVTRSRRSLFLHDGDPHLGMDLDPDVELAEIADRLRQIDLALVDVDAQLLELALDVARGDGAVELLLFADFDLEGEMHVRQPRGLALRGRFLGGALLGHALTLVGDLLLVGLGRRVGEPVGQEVVAGVAVLHLHDLPDLAQMLYVFPQNDFHRQSLGCIGPAPRAAARRRRYWYQVSVMPSVHSPGSTNTSGTASAAAAAATITSVSAEMPNASANVATIAAPRSTYSVLATSPRFVPATCRTLETGRINTPSQATIPHTHSSPM